MVTLRQPHNTLLGIAAALSLSAPLPALAHRLDELLVATRIDIASDALTLEIDLQPGVALLAEFMSWIDADNDALISQPEGAKFAQSLIRSTALQLDDTTLELVLLSVETPTSESLELGQGRLQIVAKTDVPPRIGLRKLHYVCAFRADVSVYLVNAYLPRDPLIALGKQTRDKLQRVYDVQFTQHAQAPSGEDAPPPGYQSGASLIQAVIQLSRASINALSVHQR